MGRSSRTPRSFLGHSVMGRPDTVCLLKAEKLLKKGGVVFVAKRWEASWWDRDKLDRGTVDRVEGGE